MTASLFAGGPDYIDMMGRIACSHEAAALRAGTLSLFTNENKGGGNAGDL
jgi:hypothetical protein